MMWTSSSSSSSDSDELMILTENETLMRVKNVMDVIADAEV